MLEEDNEKRSLEKIKKMAKGYPITKEEAKMIISEWNICCCESFAKAKKFKGRMEIYQYLAKKFNRSPYIIAEIVNYPECRGIDKEKVKKPYWEVKN